MSEPLISVVMPVHNAVAHLREAIESILKQTLGDFELLVLNDASAPASRSAINDISGSYADPRIKLIDNKGNKGLVATLNHGMDHSQGRFIARMDADDISHPTRFERQVALMESTAADICGCHFLVVNESGKVIDSRIVPLGGHSITICLTVTTPFAHSSVMLRAEFFRSKGLRFGGIRYAEDYDLWTRAWEEGASFVAVNDFLVTYRDHGTSTTKNLSREYSADAKLIRRRFVGRNAAACARAVRELTGKYESLSRPERMFLIWASYAVSLRLKQPLVLEVVRRSDRKSIVLAFLTLLKGLKA